MAKSQTQVDYEERHKSWQKYAKGEIKKGKKPVAFKYWRTDLKDKPKTETESVYFRGMKRESYESQMAKAGMTKAEINKLKGKSSKYSRSK